MGLESEIALNQANGGRRLSMLEITFLPSVGTPDPERALEFLAPIVAEVWETDIMRPASSNQVRPHEAQRGDSVA